MPKHLVIPEGLWTNDDAVSAREFFERTKAGQKILEILKANMPEIKGKDRDERYDASLQMQTWNDCVNSLAQFCISVADEGEDPLEPIDFSTVSNEKFKGDKRYLPQPVVTPDGQNS